MKKISIIFLLAVILAGQAICQPGNLRAKPGGNIMPVSGQTFVAGNNAFLLNGKPFVVRAAELHYPRIPRAYWEHRIQLCKAMGMNTICIYLFWNLHEQQPGQFDFTGQNDVAEFVRLVQKNGMYCIVRPGPYVCAEWEMGGLPWWLLKKKDLKLRDVTDKYFIERTGKFFGEVGKQLSPLQIQRGGNIIMVQVENEYASYGGDAKYMETIRDMLRSSGFDKTQLFRCDWSSNFNKYKLDGVATTLNFGAGSNVDKEFTEFKKAYPNAPLMCSEYWTGWFDHWGRPHETRSINSFIGSLKDMMDRKISFSLYMAHGGTSFGQWGGANAGPYSAMVSSYDYNAPIDEQGATTEKFFAVRNLLKNYLQEGEALGEVPPPKRVITIPPFELKQTALLFENLPPVKKSVEIKPMEFFDQAWGRILYRHILPGSKVSQKLIITEVRDWATIFLNGKPIGKLDRRRGDSSIWLPPMPANASLDILVEATGRVNYGKAILDHKGITQKVEIVQDEGKTELKNWDIYNFPVDYTFQKKLKYRPATKAGPGWYKGIFNVNIPGDFFLDVSKWGKGMVWLNGYNLGRYWKIGPQQTMFVPGVWLKKGANEIIILDLEGSAIPVVAGLDKPVLDQISPDETLLHKVKGQHLDLSGENVLQVSNMVKSSDWQQVDFSSTSSGRYFCLEAINAQVPADATAALAEIELIGANNEILSSLSWKVVYASSEEVTAGNHNAEKLYDKQESTYWQTQVVGEQPKYPHQVLIDLGREEHIKGMRYLFRQDRKTEGLIKDFRIFLKTQPFKL
jgi:beta-galactosidase